MVFSSGFIKKQKKKSKSKVKLIPILTAEQLLSNLKKQWWLKKIQEYLAIPDEHFERLYISLVNRFAEFVQVLPTNLEGKLGGLLSEGLSRGFLALKALHESKEPYHPRYAYALFSAGLLVNIGRVVEHSKIFISNKKGHFISEWSPYKGSMIDLGEYYKLRRYGSAPARLPQYTAALFARQIMPDIGFTWLTEDTQLFHMWLAMLNEDRIGAGSIDLHLTIALEDLEYLIDINDLFSAEHVELIETPDVQEAEDFLEWLQEELEADNLLLDVEDGDVFTLAEGVFISMDVFKQFYQKYATYGRNYMHLVEQFNHLGLNKQSGNQYKFQKYTDKNTKDWKVTEAIGKNEAAAIEKKDAKSFAAQKANKLSSLLGTEKTAIETLKEGVVIKDTGLLVKNVEQILQNPKTSEALVAWALEGQLPQFVADKAADYSFSNK